MFKTAVVIFSAIILQGCSGSSVKQANPAAVTSTPSGATVYARDETLGKTPLQYKLYEAFPAAWQGGAYQASGVLMLKKDGCEDYTLNVSDHILSKPIHAELKCGTLKSAEKSTMGNATSHTTEERLAELETLYKKGIVTENEYKSTRVRILNDL